MTVYSIGVNFESVSNVTATPSVDVGARRTEGNNEYLYVYNAGNSQISPGFLAIVSGVSGYSVSVSSVSSVDMAIGHVRNATLTTGTYGWIVTHGFVQGVMSANESCTAGSVLMPAADGTLVQKTISTGFVGVCHAKAQAAVASGTSGSFYIRCF